MSENPYKVLGVSPDATEDEIKKKYRTLVKQYHPDLHPNDEEAARKMSEINEAYEQIKSGNVSPQSYSSGTSSSPGGSFTRGSTTYYYQYGDPEEIFRAFFGGYGFNNYAHSQFSSDPYSRIESCINSGYYSLAAEILNSISVHDAKWYYYAAVVSHGMNQYSDALNFADEAVRLDPHNEDYRSLSEKLHSYYGKNGRHLRRSHPLLSVFTTFLAIMLILQLLRPLFYLFRF